MNDKRKNITLAALLMGVGLSGVYQAEAAQVMIKITKWSDDGILQQYSNNPGTYPVTQEKLSFISFGGAPDDCVRPNGTRIFDTTVGALEAGTGENNNGTFTGNEVVKELKKYEDVGLSVDNVLIYREDWLKRGTTGGPWEEDPRILSVKELADVRSAIANSNLKSKNTIKIIQLLGARVNSKTVKGNRGDTWFDIVKNATLMKHLKNFDGVGTECHVGDHNTSISDGPETLDAMAAITKWAKDNNKIGYIFMGGTSATYTQMVNVRNTYNALWNRMDDLGVDKKSDHLIYFRQGARPGTHTPENKNSLSAQTKELIGKVWTAPVAKDLGVVINAAHYDAESHPNNNNKIRDNGNSIGNIVNGSWVRYNDFNFAGGCGKIEVLAATPNSGKIEVRYKSLTGPLLGTVNITSTGKWNYYKTFSKKISSRGGTQDLYLVFKGGSGGLFNLKSLKILSYADGRSTKKTENTSSSVVYSGAWKTQNSANDSGGSMTWSKTEGNTVKYTFTGDRAKVAVRKGPHGGKCRIYLDGNVVASSVDTYASSGAYKKVIHDTGVLKTYGKHTIEVQVLSGGKNTMFDFFSTNE